MDCFGDLEGEGVGHFWGWFVVMLKEVEVVDAMGFDVELREWPRSRLSLDFMPISFWRFLQLYEVFQICHYELKHIGYLNYKALTYGNFQWFWSPVFYLA